MCGGFWPNNKQKESEEQTFKIGPYSCIIPRRSTHERVQKVRWRHIGRRPGIVLLGIHESETDTQARACADTHARHHQIGRSRLKSRIEPYLPPSSGLLVPAKYRCVLLINLVRIGRRGHFITLHHNNINLYAIAQKGLQKDLFDQEGWRAMIKGDVFTRANF